MKNYTTLTHSRNILYYLNCCRELNTEVLILFYIGTTDLHKKRNDQN